MNRNRYTFLSTLVLALTFAAGIATAAPIANSVVTKTRVFNNCPTSVITVVDNEFAQVIIDDAQLDCFGFANRHIWDFSTDNTNPIDFQNSDQFSFCATVLATGTGDGEIGLRLSPWWSLDVDGVFMLNTRSGEIAVFGGRLPFYSFTVNHGQTYTKGSFATLSMDYRPNGLSASSPATIEYRLVNANGVFSSGPLAFDQGNPAEDPPHGQWGILQPSHAGGYVQAYLNNDGIPVNFRAEWTGICYDATPTPAGSSTWGRIKADYR